jgi:hypothetical protein
MIPNELLHGGYCPVPNTIAVCPECGGQLYAENNEWDGETGIPVIGGLIIDCKNDSVIEGHRYLQSDWQSITSAIEKWCSAKDV